MVQEGGRGRQPVRHEERRCHGPGERDRMAAEGRRPGGYQFHSHFGRQVPQRGRGPRGQGQSRRALQDRGRQGRYGGPVRPGVHAGFSRGHPGGPRRGREVLHPLRRPGRHRRLPVHRGDPLRERRVRPRRVLLPVGGDEGGRQGAVQPRAPLYGGRACGHRQGQGMVRGRGRTGLRPRLHHARQHGPGCGRHGIRGIALQGRRRGGRAHCPVQLWRTRPFRPDKHAVRGGCGMGLEISAAGIPARAGGAYAPQCPGTILRRESTL